MSTTKQERVAQVDQFLEVVASCGRKFFAHNGRVSRFEVDMRGRVWFVDAYRPARIYLQCRWGRWRGFSEGGTLRNLVLKLCDYIRTGEQQQLGLGPWPEWLCGGDLWGYGEAMAQVRAAARAYGLMPSNAGE
jgi:hypothetical protein